MVILSEFRIKQYGDDDHPEDASLFTLSIRVTVITEYLSGFALFLWIVISRLAGLLADKARVKAEAAAAKAQAESASRTAELLIDQQKEKEEKGEEGVEDDIKKEIADLKKRLEAVSNSRRDSMILAFRVRLAVRKIGKYWFCRTSTSQFFDT